MYTPNDPPLRRARGANHPLSTTGATLLDAERCPAKAGDVDLGMFSGCGRFRIT